MKELTAKAREALTQRLLAAGDEPERAQLRSALERIAAGSFGLCEKCGGPIGRHRLTAVPEATRCLACGSRE